VEQGIVFNLFWNIDGVRTLVTDDPRFQVEFIDTDGNGIVDQMRWIVPQLSEQLFEIIASLILKSLLADGTLNATSFSELLQRTETENSVRVIVELNTDFIPPGLLQSVQQRLEQRTDIENTQDGLLQSLSSFNVESKKTFKNIPVIAMTVDRDALVYLSSSPFVKIIHEDKLNKPSLADSVPYIGGSAAHSSGFTGLGQTIAILDTGVESSHSFLSGKVVSEACFGTTETGTGFTSTTFCPSPDVNGEGRQRL